MCFSIASFLLLRGEVEPGGKRRVKEKSIKVDYESWKMLKMESLKRGKPVKKVLREILNEWRGQEEDTT
jgi:macrodomain Ter protein organizer (MatP/YcbG family)